LVRLQEFTSFIKDKVIINAFQVPVFFYAEKTQERFIEGSPDVFFIIALE
jgi:hypothetical protein